MSFNFSPLVIHRMYPAVQVNIDIRDYVYGEPLFLEYTRALSLPAAVPRRVRCLIPQLLP